MSEHDLRPKEVLDRARREEDRALASTQQEYNKLLNGKIASRKDWTQYHKLPDKLTPVSQTFRDPHIKAQKERNPFLDKQEYESPYLQMAR